METQSFRKGNSSEIDVAYVATDADFSRYSALLVDEMGVYFPTSAGIAAEDVARIRQIFRSAFAARLEGYEITQQPGPGMLWITASFVDLRNADPVELPAMRSELREIVSPGEILFIMEMRDSSTRRVLARAGDSKKTPGFGSGPGEATDWASVEDAAEYWAARFRAFLDQNLGEGK